MTCARCPNDRPFANLTVVGDELVCPECLYSAPQHQITHPEPAPPAPVVPTPPDFGLTVVDLPRGMAGRRAALARRRSA